MTDDGTFGYDATCIVFGLLAMAQGWAFVLHTDGTFEGRPREIPPCPECDQDRARAAAEAQSIEDHAAAIADELEQGRLDDLDMAEAAAMGRRLVSGLELRRGPVVYDVDEISSRVAWHGRPIPQSRQEWQYCVDMAEVLMLIESARAFGLVTGGPEINQAKCEWMIDAASRLGIEPDPPEGLLQRVLAELGGGTP